MIIITVILATIAAAFTLGCIAELKADDISPELKKMMDDEKATIEAIRKEKGDKGVFDYFYGE